MKRYKVKILTPSGFIYMEINEGHERQAEKELTTKYGPNWTMISSQEIPQ